FSILDHVTDRLAGLDSDNVPRLLLVDAEGPRSQFDGLFFSFADNHFRHPSSTMRRSISSAIDRANSRIPNSVTAFSANKISQVVKLCRRASLQKLSRHQVNTP